jgi:AI-2 transport protein TqsA
MIISIVIIIAIGVLTTYMLANSLSGLSDKIPAYTQKLTEYGNNLSEFAKSKNLNLPEMTSGLKIDKEKAVTLAGNITGSVSGVISNSLLIIILIILFVFDMVDYESDTRKGKIDKLSIHDWIVGLVKDLQKYMSINALEGGILGAMNYVFLLIMGVDFAFLWAFISFFMNFIPNIGFVLSVVGPGLIALITLGPDQALIVIIGFVIINFIVENVLGPIFMKQGLSISMLNSLLSMLIWGWILGATGAFIGVPLTMVLMKMQSNSNDKPES